MCTDTFIANDKKGLTTAKPPLFVIHRLTLIVIGVALSLTLCGPELELYSHAKESWEGAFMLPPRLMPELEAVLPIYRTGAPAAGRVPLVVKVITPELSTRKPR
jgi:hypothetical protein